MLDEALAMCQRATGDLAAAISSAGGWRDETRAQVDGAVVEPLQASASAFAGALQHAAPQLAGALARLRE